MRTSFSGYETGLRALQAHQLALEVTGHNLANAGAAGYSRQTLRLQATDPYTMPTMSKTSIAGMIGTGVQVTDIRAVRDLFLDSQVRDQTAGIGFFETRQQVLEELQVIFNEPQGEGLRSIIDKFWTAWQNVAANPSQMQFRQVLVQAGQELGDAFRTAYGQFTALQDNLGDTIGSTVNEANALFRQIAELNVQIAHAQGVGDNPNDLIDARSRILENLSSLMDVSTSISQNGSLDVFVSGHAAVSGFSYDQLASEIGPSSDPAAAGHLDLPPTGSYTVFWQNTSGATRDPLVTKYGKFAALVDAANTILPEYINNLETMAQELVFHVNAQHAQGYGLGDGALAAPAGRPFFAALPVGSTTAYASMLTVDQAIINDPSLIAAAATPGELPGLGGNARQIAATMQQQLIGGTTTLDDFFRGMIGGLGVKTQESQRLAENGGLLLAQIENQRAAISGVSTDEELVNMMKFQQGYNAAARIVTTVDEMIDTIINRMGLVGR